MLCLYNTCQKGITNRGLPNDVPLRPPLAKDWQCDIRLADLLTHRMIDVPIKQTTIQDEPLLWFWSLS